MENFQKQPKFERTTQEQLLFYIDFCQRNPELLAGKNSPRSPIRLQELWAELAASLNAIKGPTRTPAKWTENLGVWKSQLRARARKKKSEQQFTGGGPCSSRMLNDFEERALSTFGAAAVDGVAGIVTLGIEASSQMATNSPASSSPASSSPLTISVGPTSPGAVSLGSSSPLTQFMWPCSPAAESLQANSPPAILSPSPSTISLRPRSPGAVSQKDIYATVMRSIEQRDARDERMIQLQLSTLQAIEKLAAAIEKIADQRNN